jgi:hypothetical protein
MASFINIIIDYIDNIVHDENQTEQIKQHFQLITRINHRKKGSILILQTKIVLIFLMFELTRIVANNLLVKIMFILQTLLIGDLFETVAGDELLLIGGFHVGLVLAAVLADRE